MVTHANSSRIHHFIGEFQRIFLGEAPQTPLQERSTVSTTSPLSTSRCSAFRLDVFCLVWFPLCPDLCHSSVTLPLSQIAPPPPLQVSGMAQSATLKDLSATPKSRENTAKYHRLIWPRFAFSPQTYRYLDDIHKIVFFTLHAYNYAVLENFSINSA